MNPADEIELPKQRRRELRVPTKDQILTLMKVSEENVLWPLWLLMMTTGLRPGECLGLKWRDLDLEVGKIVVQRVIIRIRGQGWNESLPKTSRSRRTVTVPSKTIRVLQNHRKCQLEIRLRAGGEWVEHDFVFTDLLGDPLNWHHARRTHWRPLVKAVGLEYLRPYDLRHLHATLLLSEGVPIRAISERLGHYDAGFTLSTYTHTMPGTQEMAAEAIEAALESRHAEKR